jgi:hypothetical protein
MQLSNFLCNNLILSVLYILFIVLCLFVADESGMNLQSLFPLQAIDIFEEA